MAKFIITNNSTSLSYPVISDSYANLENALDKWIKFTWESKTRKINIFEGIRDRNIISFRQTEMDEYYRIRKQLFMSVLLEKYKIKIVIKKNMIKL